MSLTHETIVGRDKVLRTLQYFSRFWAWYLYRTNHRDSSLIPFTAMKVQFGLTRKLLRVGKFVEHFRAATDLYDKLKSSPGGLDVSGDKDKIMSYLQIVRQLGYGFYMVFDTMTVPDAIGMWKDVRAKEWQRTAYRAWLVGLLASAVSGVYGTYRLRERAKGVNVREGEGKVDSKLIEKYVVSPDCLPRTND